MVPEDKIVQVPEGGTVRVVGAIQGLVIGNHNTVNQNFSVTRHEAYVAQECHPVPTHWVERADLVTRATYALKAGSVVALCGMGGSGKSSLAARVAAEVGSRFAAGCFWIDLAADNTDEALLRIALAFGHDISLLKSRDARAQTIRSLISGQAVLLVLDDAWSTADLDAFLPLPGSCAALMTTRNDAIAASIATEVISVDELAPTDAVSLLAATSGSPATEPFLQRVAVALGGLPLALELAGKLARQQARRPGFSWSTFAADFGKSTHRLSIGLAGTTVRTAFDTTWTRALGAETQRAFALLGIFEPGNITSAEATAAWNVDDRLALAHLNELIDLSLVRQVAADLLCLHPLLADYALEMAEHLAPEELTNAHCRVADHLFRIAPRPPRNMHDMAIVLRSHNHAVQACDRVRAERVFPWFKGDMDRSVAVPGFLIDHGLHRLNLFHHRLKFKLSEGDSAYARSYQFYWLGQALDRAGELAEAEEHLQIAVELIESPEVDDEGRAIGLSKFLMGLGQLQAQLGELDKAEATFQRAIDFDRKTDIAGGVVGAHQGALIGLLQLADVFAQSVRPDGGEQAERICRDVYAEALEHGEAQIAIMALARLASQLEQSNPKQALEYSRVAKRISQARPDAFADRQGARYARLFAVCTMQLTLSGNSALDDALNWFCLAIGNAGRCEARQELGHALYLLGNLFEHYFLIDLESPLIVAWACYALSETYTKENEGGSPLNAQFRIDERIIPCIEESNRATAAAAVATDPWGLIDAELSPYALGWRPAP